MRPGNSSKRSAEQERVRAMKARDARLRESGKSTSHGASIPTERRDVKPVPTPPHSSGYAHESTHAHGERAKLPHKAGPARKATPARKTMHPFETDPRARQDPRVKQCTHPNGYADEGWTGRTTSRTCQPRPSRGSGRTREVDAESDWLEDLAEHLKTMGKDKMFRDLLARDNEKESDALHNLHEYELPP